MMMRYVSYVSALVLALGVLSCQAELIAYPHVGCFRDWRILRDMYLSLGNHTAPSMYRIHEDGVFRCFEAAKAAGYNVVGIGDGKCWSGTEAHKFYNGYKTATGCKDGLGGNGTYDIYQINSAEICDDLPDGEYQDALFCNRLVTCFHGTTTVQLCPEGLLFNPGSSQCEPANKVACPRGEPCKWAPDGEYVHPASCRKYVVCYNNQAFEVTCPGYLWFNIETKECESPEKVLCQHNPCKESPCRNGGTCQQSNVTKSHYKCICTEDFMGIHCENKAPHPCKSGPCVNGATCKELDGEKFECKCVIGFGGNICQNKTMFDDSAVLKDHPGAYSSLVKILEPIQKQDKLWKKCYKASEHSYSSSEFHKACDSKGPTVVLVKVRLNIFGGYADMDWVGSMNNYRRSDKSFLFSLKNRYNKSFKMSVYKNHGNAQYSNNGYGPTFGGGHDFYLANSCHSNTNSYCSLGHTYRSPEGMDSTQAKQLLAGSANFRVDEYEVYYQVDKK